MECPFHVGQRITLNTPPQSERAEREGLRFGDVYTISWIGEQEGYCGEVYGKHIVLRLQGVHHTRSRHYPDGAGWTWRNFRPVTDISSLESLLHTTPVKQKEPA